MTRIRYHQIADDLRARVVSGELAPGQVLPSEAALGSQHGASRVTIRKALELLRSEGLVDSRQGFGWFVAAETVSQPLAGLVTIEAQLESLGRISDRRVVDFRFTEAPATVGPLLGERVLEVRRLNLADGEPFARVTVWCREDLGESLSLADVEESSFYELLERSVTIGGATQTIGADTVSDDDAKLLRIPRTSPVLVVRRITRAPSDEPLLVSEHVFPGHLTEFVAELSRRENRGTGSPPGMRLVDE